MITPTTKLLGYVSQKTIRKYLYIFCKFKASSGEYSLKWKSVLALIVQII